MFLESQIRAKNASSSRAGMDAHGIVGPSPPILENLLRFVWRRLQHIGKLIRVSINRHSCNESCTYYGPRG
jgi:hypothetical protein